MGELRKLLILSIWNDPWSLGEGSGVPDERYFIRRLVDAGIELHYLIPESVDGSEGVGVVGVGVTGTAATLVDGVAGAADWST